MFLINTGCFLLFQALTLQRPVIVSPRNGSSYQIPHGERVSLSFWTSAWTPSVLTSLLSRLRGGDILQSYHRLSGRGLHRSHVAGQRTVGGGLLPGQARAAGRQEVLFKILQTPTRRRSQRSPALFTVARVTRVSEGCEIELRLIVLEISEADVSTELRCVARDRAGSQDVVTHLELEGKDETRAATGHGVKNDVLMKRLSI